MSPHLGPIQQYMNFTQEKPPTSEEVISVMLDCAAGMTPSIHKTLDFVTAKPVGSPIAGLTGVKKQLDQIFTHHVKFAKAYERLKVKRPRGE